MTTELRSASTLALASEVCMDDLLDEWHGLAARGAGIIAVSADVGPADDESRVDPFMVTRRGVERATEVAREIGLGLFVLADASDSPLGCTDPRIGQLGRSPDRQGATGSSAPSATVFCSSSRDDRLRLFTAIQGEDSADPARIAINDFVVTVPSQACFDSPGLVTELVPRAGRLVGFAVAPTADNLLRNGNFRDGWNGWYTSGALRLEARSRPGGRTDCSGLAAVLGTGAGIRQEVRQLAPDEHAALSIDLLPSRHPQHLRGRLGGRAFELKVPANRARATITLQAGEGPQALELENPEDEPRSILGVRLARTTKPTCLGTTAVAQSLEPLVQRFEPQGESAESRVADAHVLDPRQAKIASSPSSGLPGVRTVRIDGRAGETGIMAHPGPDRTTELAFVVPPMGCKRRLRTGAVIASACRNTGDGAGFAVRSVAGTIRTHVDASANEPEAMEVDLDETDDAAASPTDVVLATDAGPRGDARCDWAVWVAPTIACVAPPSDRDIPDAVAPRLVTLAPTTPPKVVPTRWDEINVWKLYTFFGPHRASSVPGSETPGWLKKRLPWLTHVRVLAALGGNSCRHIREQCQRGVDSPDHPFREQTWECKDERAAKSEILKESATGQWKLDFVDWEQAIDDILASGVLPHINISAAPCALTDGHAYRDYHWNQKPVRDHESWLALVDAAAVRIATRPSAKDWRFSIVNEPNCLWLAHDDTRDIAASRLGFTGTSDEYAVHFAETAAHIRSHLPDAKIHLGNYTIGGKFPLEDSLPEYLGALPQRLAEHRLSPKDFSAISFSLYESPQHPLTDLATFKLGRLDHAIDRKSPFASLPLKVDEEEIHALVLDAFRESTGEDLDATYWAAAWHAEFLAFAIENGMISVAPWLGRLFSDSELLRPHPKYWAYALASIAMNDVVPDTLPIGNARRLDPAEPGATRSMLRDLHRASEDQDGLGWLIADAPDGARYFLIWQHSDEPRRNGDLSPSIRASFEIAPPDLCPPGLMPELGEILSLSAQPNSDMPVWRPEPFSDGVVRSAPLTIQDGARVSVTSESVHLLRVACTADQRA